MRWSLFGLFAATLALATPLSVGAQLVQVGAGFVHAPFVDVEWGHGVHVRAPFVDVHTSGYCSDHACCDVAARPYKGPIGPVGYVRRQLTAASRDLNESLSRFDTGGTWQRYLMLGPGMPLSEEELARANPAHDLAGLQKALANFDSASQNKEYAVITRLPAFIATHDLLRAYVKRLDTRASQPEEVPPPTPGSAS